MSKNVSHVVVHHHYDNEPNANGVFCSVVLGVVVVLLLLIILAIAVYAVIQRTRCKEQDARRSLGTLEPPRGIPRAVFNNYKKEDRKRRSSTTPQSPPGDRSRDVNSNLHSVGVSHLKDEMRGGVDDTSDSSAGLCEVLFPPKDDQEVLYENPGFEAGAADYRKTSRSDTGASSDPAPSRSASSTNPSLDWDFYESRRFRRSSASNVLDGKSDVNVCWV